VVAAHGRGRRGRRRRGRGPWSGTESGWILLWIFSAGLARCCC
jgi:hypothetical protein